jgi:murein L,D-transpeptidase YcbB/YkuD
LPLDSAEAEGLDPAAYRVAELRQLRETARRDISVNRKKHLAQLDLLATSDYLKYASHLVAGRIDPHALDTNWIAHPRQVDLNDHLRKALESKAIRQSLLELLPTHWQYGLLKAQLARYRAAAGGAAGNTSATGPRTAGHLSDDQLRNRLAFYGLVDTTQVAAREPGGPDRLGRSPQTISIAQRPRYHRRSGRLHSDGAGTGPQRDVIQTLANQPGAAPVATRKPG